MWQRFRRVDAESAPHPAGAATSEKKAGNADLLCGLALIVGMFVLLYAIECRFDDLGVFNQYNVLFDTDPNSRINNISHGWGCRSIVHPNFSNYFSLPIRLVARGTTIAGISSDEMAFRRQLGMLIVPLVGALGVWGIFAVFRCVDFPIWKSMVSALTGGLSFSQLIFGSTPEHFALGGLTIILSYLLAVDLLRNGGRVRWVLWLIAGVLTMGCTSTNIASCGLLFVACYFYSVRSWQRALAYSLILFAVTTGVTMTTGSVCGALYGEQWDPRRTETVRSMVTQYLTPDYFSRVAAAPGAIANTIAPTRVDTMENTVLTGEQKFNYQFTLENTAGPLYVLIGLSFLITGTIGCLSEKRFLRPLALGSLSILAFNVAMHTFFGPEYFLYSQHWLMPVVVLLSGNLAFRGPWDVIASSCLSLLVVGIALNNALRLNAMLSLLANATTL